MHAVDWLVGLDELSPESGGRWVAAALAEADALRGHDDRLYPPAGEEAGLRAAEGLRETWRRWADDAEALLRRVALVGGPGTISGVDRLDYEVGRARAMLKLRPADVHRARRQGDLGQTHTAEAVRRELGLSTRR